MAYFGKYLSLITQLCYFSHFNVIVDFSQKNNLHMYVHMYVSQKKIVYFILIKDVMFICTFQILETFFKIYFIL